MNSDLARCLVQKIYSAGEGLELKQSRAAAIAQSMAHISSNQRASSYTSPPSILKMNSRG